MGVIEDESDNQTKKNKRKADVILLKKDHHHLNTFYPKGTELKKLDADTGSIDVMKDRGII